MRRKKVLVHSEYMWGWIAGAAALVMILVVAAHLDFIKKNDIVNSVTTQFGDVTQQISDKVTATIQPMNTALTLRSTAFENNASIPSIYTCDATGTAQNPPLEIAGVPQEAKSLALIMDDPDVPKQVKPDGVFDHWVLYNIPASTTLIDTGASAGQAGLNGSGKAEYTAPCPPKQYEPSEHRYVFSLYALDVPELSFKKPPTKAEVLQAIEGHTIAQAQLVGRYKRM